LARANAFDAVVQAPSVERQGVEPVGKRKDFDTCFCLRAIELQDELRD
jgi:hypothetical protein